MLFRFFNAYIFFTCLILCLFTTPSHALTSHWIVTQQGKIEQKLIGDSGTFLPLKRPYDLVAFLNQEKRAEHLVSLEALLLKQVDKVRHLEQLLTTGPSLFEESNGLDCGAYGNILEFDLYLSTIVPLQQKGINILELLEFAIPTGTQLLEPNCIPQTPLTLSLIIFDNLSGVKNRSSLKGSPETSLRNSIPHRDKLDEFGHAIATSLATNHTSWVLLNLANLYWRLKGIPLNAVECSRMSLHYSPAEFREIALVNLANVLHRGKHSQDAAIVMISSITSNPDLPVSLLTLGNVFSILGLYQRAAVCYNRSFVLDPTFDMARRRFQAAQCNAKIHRVFSESLEQAKTEVENYQFAKQELDKEFAYPPELPPESPIQLAIAYIENLELSLELEEDLLSVLGNFDEIEFVASYLEDGENNSNNSSPTNRTKPEPNTTFSPVKANKTKTSRPPRPKPRLILRTYDETLTSMNKPSAIQVSNKTLREKAAKDSSKQENKSKVIPNPEPIRDKHIYDSDPLDDPLLESIDSLYTEHYFHPADTQNTDTNQISPVSDADAENEDLDKAEFPPYNPISEVIEKRIFQKVKGAGPPLKHDDPYWPGKRECTAILKTLSSWERYPSTHVPPQPKLFRSFFRHIPLTTEIRAPLCQNIIDLPNTPFAMDHLPGIMYRHTYPQLVPENGLKATLFEAVEANHKKLNLEISEVGTKLFDAMKKFGPDWSLLALSGLYWRVVGNHFHSLECYRRVAFFAPEGEKSIAYIGMANILHRNNFIEDAIITARLAIEYSHEEPISHYTLAKILSSQGNLAASSLHLRYALRIHREYTEAVDTLRVVRCYLKFDQEKLRLEKQQKVLVEHQKRLEEEQRWLKGEGPKFNAPKKVDSLQIESKEVPTSAEEATTMLRMRKAKLTSLYSRGLLEHDMMADQMEVMVELEDLYEKLTQSLPYNSSKDNESNPYDFRKKDNSALERLKALKEIPFFFVQLNEREVLIRENINFDISLSEETHLPRCRPISPGLMTLDHLEPMILRRKVHLPLIPNVLNLLLGEFHRELIDIQPWPLRLPYGLSQNLKKDKTNWVAAHLSAHYWLSQGRSYKAMECIRLALYNAPPNYRDIPLMLLTNYLLLAGFTEEALVTADMAMDIHSLHPVYYFAKALIYFSQGNQLRFREFVQKAELMKRRRARIDG